MDLKFVVRVGGDVTRRQLAFTIPQALGSRVDLLLEEPDADVEFPSAVSFSRKTGAKETRVSAVLGASDKFEVNWTPRVKRAADVAATAFVQIASVATVGGGVVNTRSVLDYQVSQGELKRLQIRIPVEQRVLRVEGDSLRTWDVSDDVLVGRASERSVSFLRSSRSKRRRI